MNEQLLRSVKSPSTVGGGISSSGQGKVFQTYQTKGEEVATEIVLTPASGEDEVPAVPQDERKRLQTAQQSGRRKRTMPNNFMLQKSAPRNPLIRGSQFNEKDLFQANNLYNFLDKGQHIFGNKMFAQSSLNQVRLQKEADKYREMILDDSQCVESSLGHYPNNNTFTKPASQLTMQTNNWVNGPNSLDVTQANLLQPRTTRPQSHGGTNIPTTRTVSQYGTVNSAAFAS